MSNLIGNFQFKHYDGDVEGYYTLGVRFNNWKQDPSHTFKPDSNENVKYMQEMFTTKKFRKPYWVDNSKPDTEPIPLDNSPQNAYLKELILKSDKLGAKFASHDSHSWHIDGENANDNYTFSALWGTYLDDLP